MTPLLEVTDLAVTYRGAVQALRGISFRLEPGESLAVIGETGAGKSTLALSLCGLVQPPEARGSVLLAGRQLIGADAATLRTLRWRTVAIGLQGAPFNPVATVGSQIAEPIVEHLGTSAREARARAAGLALEVGLDPEILDRYPHQLSGGDRRRASLAMALALGPALLVLDEPTAGLDPGGRRDLVERIGAAVAARGAALVIVSHDLGDVVRLAERVMVLYAGEAVEVGPTRTVVGDPLHPYTWALVNAHPVLATTKDLRPIRGLPPDPAALPPGCAYHPRCTQAERLCTQTRPVLAADRGRQVACHLGGLRVLLHARGLAKTFAQGRRRIRALDAVDVALREGESLGVVGPSGSGKTTLARILAGHLAPDSGEVLLEGVPLAPSWRRARRIARRRVQLIMQDPWDALSPHLAVEDLVAEPLDLGDGAAPADRAAAVRRALAEVGLPSADGFLRARTHELSGGQLQRIALARALLAGPKVLVADEPTSMLDPSEQARFLLLLRERQVEMGLGLVLVSHDLALVRRVTDRIVVLDGGRVVEEGPSAWITARPRSPTARRLLAAAPALSLLDDTSPAPRAEEPSEPPARSGLERRSP